MPVSPGYFARVSAIDTLIERFLTSKSTSGFEPADQAASDYTPKRQIISLGAGKDTTFFKLAVSVRVECFEFHITVTF